MAKMDWAEVADDVRETLTELGSEVHIVRYTGGDIDPITSLPAPKTEELFPTYGVEADFDITDVDGETIRSGDKQVILDTTVPVMDTDLIQLADGSRWPIAALQTIAPDGIVVVVYVAVLRR